MSTRRLLRFALISIALFLWAGSQAQADVLRLATVALPPFGYKQEGQAMGLTFDMGNAIATEAGFTPVNTVLPLIRAVEDIQRGTIDAVIMFPGPKISELAIDVGEVVAVDIVAVPATGKALHGLKDLRGEPIASVSGACYDSTITEKNGFILYPTYSYEQSLKMLRAGRVKAALGPGLGLFHSARAMGLGRKDFGTPLLVRKARASLFLAKPKADGKTLGRLRQAIARLQQRGEIDKMVSGYSSF